METEKLYKKIRRLLIFFSLALVVSGITAIPVQWEMEQLIKMRFLVPSELMPWLYKVKEGIDYTSLNHSYLLYGFDWLAFAHIVIALFFIGPIKDPVKNIFIIETGMIACVLIFPLAFICGSMRGIPLFWTLIDCSFGVIGLIPLYLARKYTRQLEEKISTNTLSTI